MRDVLNLHNIYISHVFVHETSCHVYFVPLMGLRLFFFTGDKYLCFTKCYTAFTMYKQLFFYWFYVWHERDNYWYFHVFLKRNFHNINIPTFLIYVYIWCKTTALDHVSGLDILFSLVLIENFQIKSTDLFSMFWNKKLESIDGKGNSNSLNNCIHVHFHITLYICTCKNTDDF